jgi:hypothetical protein
MESKRREAMTKIPASSRTRYFVTDTSRKGLFTEGAEVGLTHPSTTYDDISTKPFYQEKNQHDYESDRHRVQIGEGAHGQRALFDVFHRKPYVDWMATHPDFRGHVGTMLGVVGVESKHRFGEIPAADTDLSVHSSRVVDRLAQAGAIKAPEGEQRNGITADEFHDFQVRNPVRDPQTEEVPRSTVAMGRQFLRDALRGPKKQVTKSVKAVSEKAKGKQERMF